MRRVKGRRVAATNRGMKRKAFGVALDQVAYLAAHGTGRTQQRKAPE